MEYDSVSFTEERGAEIFTDLIIYIHQNEIDSILGTKVCFATKKKTFRHITKFLLLSLVGNENDIGIISRAAGSYGYNLVMKEYMKWFEEHEVDIVDMIDLVTKQKDEIVSS